MEDLKKIYVVHMAITDPIGDFTMDMLDNDSDMTDVFSNNDTPPDNVEKVVNEEDLFNETVEDGEHSESVDSNGDIIDKGGDTSNSTKESSTPLSSILSALKDDGILPDVDDKLIKEAKTPEDFATIIEQQVEARLDAANKRVKEALDSGIPVNEVKEYEGLISYLDTINDAAIEQADDAGEALRKDLIYQDFINRGFKPERAKKEVEKSFTAGTDIEDAKNALESNKEYFVGKYNDVINENKQAKAAAIEAQRKQREQFIKKINDTNEPFNGIKLDPGIKKKILDNATKIVEKDSDGTMYTPVQKYIKDNPIDAQYYLSLLYTLTDGFKNIDKLVSGRVAGITKRTLSNLDKTLQSSSSFKDSGNSLFAEDDNSKSIKIDV